MISINDDLKVETYPLPTGGMSVGVLPKGVTITHVPTGISASCDFYRHQFENKNAALASLRFILSEKGFI